MEALNEVKLGRVLQHFQSDRTVVILTGFRGDKSQKENIQRNKAIAAKLRKAGFGFFYVDGYWIENQGTDYEEKVSEDSIFAIAEPERSKELIELAHTLANKFDQDAVFVDEKTGSLEGKNFVKTGEEVYLYYANGKKEKLDSTFKPDKVGDFYTQLRGKGRNHTFVFESVREGKGYFASLIEKIEREKYGKTSI